MATRPLTVRRLFVLALACALACTVLAPTGADAAKLQKHRINVKIKGAPKAGKVNIYAFKLVGVKGGKAPKMRLAGTKNAPKNLIVGGSVIPTKVKGTYKAKFYLVNPRKSVTSSAGGRAADNAEETVHVDGFGDFKVEDVKKVKDGLGKLNKKTKDLLCKDKKGVSKELREALGIGDYDDGTEAGHLRAKRIKQILTAIIRQYCGDYATGQKGDDQKKKDVTLLSALGIDVKVIEEQKPACKAPHRASAADCEPQITVEDVCDFFGADEEECFFIWLYFGSPHRTVGSAAVSNTPLDAIKIVVAGGRTITNQLCPTQLPHATVSGSTLTCDGGSLPPNTKVKYNIRTSPSPTAGQGDQVFIRQPGGDFQGPYTASGP